MDLKEISREIYPGYKWLGIMANGVWFLHMIYTIAQRNVSEDVNIKMAVRIANFARK